MGPLRSPSCIETTRTLACNGAARLSLLPLQTGFNLQLGGHIQRRCGAGISSSPTLCSRPFRLLVLVNVILAEYAGNKKPLHLRGHSFVAFSPHLAEIIRRNWHPSLPLRRVGCRASQGRIPPPLLMRFSICRVFSCLCTNNCIVSIPNSVEKCQGF